MQTIGRFAPSPSGRMHLGNVLCALLAWLSARHEGGEYLLRIEDLDTLRCPRSYAELILDDLRWLGLDWDGEILYQSERTAVYEKYEAILQEKGLLYPCFCSRAALHAASAPHLSDGRVVYAGTCRDLTSEQVAEKRKTRSPATRVRVPDEEVRFTDGVFGAYSENLARECGDFIIRRSDRGVCLPARGRGGRRDLRRVRGGARRGPDLLHTAAVLAAPAVRLCAACVRAYPVAVRPRRPPPVQAG